MYFIWRVRWWSNGTLKNVACDWRNGILEHNKVLETKHINHHQNHTRTKYPCSKPRSPGARQVQFFWFHSLHLMWRAWEKQAYILCTERSAEFDADLCVGCRRQSAWLFEDGLGCLLNDWVWVPPMKTVCANRTVLQVLQRDLVEERPAWVFSAYGDSSMPTSVGNDTSFEEARLYETDQLRNGVNREQVRPALQLA